MLAAFCLKQQLTFSITQIFENPPKLPCKSPGKSEKNVLESPFSVHICFMGSVNNFFKFKWDMGR